MPLNFTVVYDDRINDIEDSSGDVAATVAMGPVYFIPSITPGHRIPDLEYLPRPAGLAIRAFPAYLDTDGRLKTKAGGDTGVRLWANDPAWRLPRLQYQVRAELTDLQGRPVEWAPFSFDAPHEDIEVDLAREMPRPGQKFGRGRPGFGLAPGAVQIDTEGNLVLVREDGIELGGVEIPDLSDALDVAQAESISYVLTFGR